jgi:geranylgeranyl pyrophosphate synthase
MFQVRDDIIDIIGLKEGRSPGSDVMEGKVSVLTSISLAKLDGKGRKELVDMLNAPREGKEDGIVKKVARIYRETGALRDAYGLYEREKAKIFAIPVMKHNARLGEFMEEIIDSISTPLKDLERNF